MIIEKDHIVPLINALTALLIDPELEDCVNYSGSPIAIRVVRHPLGFELKEITVTPDCHIQPH